MVPALGPAMVKPCVAGTTARASSENVRSIGYSIYYTVVNIGGTLGPVMAWLVRKRLGWGMENVFRVSALSVFLMFLVTLAFFHEPEQSGEQKVASVADAIKNMFVVLRNFRFVLFLLIFSSFYIVFWQEFISAPLFLRGYVDPNANADLLLSIDALTVICFQILVSYLTRKIPAFPAMTLGLVISSLSWLIPGHPSVNPGTGGGADRAGARRNHPIGALLRIHLAACARRASRGSIWVMLSCPSPSGISSPGRWADTFSTSSATSCTGPSKCGGW